MKKLILIIFITFGMSVIKSFGQTSNNNFGKPAKIYVFETNETIFAEEVAFVTGTESTFRLEGPYVITSGMDQTPLEGDNRPVWYKGDLYRIERSAGTGGQWRVECLPDDSWCAVTWGAIAITE